jgi:quercetin dioxygenase-like cupin family protein
MSAFVKQVDVRQESFDWGTVGWRCTPENTTAKQLVVMDVSIAPGRGHDFHRHPDQEEMIIVKSGKIEQWLERECQLLGPGDSIYIDAGVVHASFNASDEPANLQVFIGPSLLEGVGYGFEDASTDEPWTSLRTAASPAGTP